VEQEGGAPVVRGRCRSADATLPQVALRKEQKKVDILKREEKNEICWSLWIPSSKIFTPNINNIFMSK